MPFIRLKHCLPQPLHITLPVPVRYLIGRFPEAEFVHNPARRGESVDIHKADVHPGKFLPRHLAQSKQASVMRMQDRFLSRDLIRLVADENKLQVPGRRLHKQAVQQGIQTVKPPLSSLMQLRLRCNLPFREAQQMNKGSHIPGLQTIP
ncbi:hypothetical protein D3C73_1117610 [compost metagenome]